MEKVLRKQGFAKNEEDTPLVADFFFQNPLMSVRVAGAAAQD